MAVDVIVTGVLGKMGMEIARIVASDPAMRLAGCTEIPGHPMIGQDLGQKLGGGGAGVKISGSIQECLTDTAVIIDFTFPDATCGLLEKIRGRKAAVVIGTTGLSEHQHRMIGSEAKERAILVSPNMSLGVNLLFCLTEIAARKLGDGFDIEIIEAHHRMKKDAPSGTAVRLGEIAASARSRAYRDCVKNGRQGVTGERSREEIGMHAVRGGDIVGDHTVLFAGPSERIELRHMAHNRAIFAQGAVAGARWLAGKSPGLYSMRDVLGL